MEIADIFVINKSDREGASKLQRELMAMLDMSPSSPGGWRAPIITVGNSFKPDDFEKDVEKLTDTILKHYEYLVNSNLIGDRLRRKTMHELNEALRSSILEPVLRVLVSTGELDRMVVKLLNKESDPCTLAEEIAEKYLQGCI
jgi:LAO/AO transport system kinase